MKFVIANTFSKSIGELSTANRLLTKQAALEFQLDPNNPAFALSLLTQAKDKSFSSFRINDSLHVIVHTTSDTLTLCYAGTPEESQQWAQRYRFETHPTTGALQIIETGDEPDTTTEPPFARYSTQDLLDIGTPVEWVDWVRQTSKENFFQNLSRLPEEVVERLVASLTGAPLSLPTKKVADTSRRFFEVPDAKILEQALDAPWEHWIIFLHPTQKEVVEKNFSGPAKIIGSAGTGKTIAALHRAAFLARTTPKSKVLLTTFTQTLVTRLAHLADLLLGEKSDERRQISVAHLHSTAIELYEKLSKKKFKELTKTKASGLIEEAMRLENTGVSHAFLVAEWEAVIEPLRIRTWTEYRDAIRTGRAKALGARQKKLFWNVFEKVLQRINQDELLSWSELCHSTADLLATQKKRPFDFVIADECQDFGMGELRLLRALVPSKENDLFLCTDIGQRIYRGSLSWQSAGIEVKGRVTRLAVNYRTTEGIRRFSDSVLPSTVSTEDGDVQRQSVSLFSGAEPEIVACPNEQSEIEQLSAWLSQKVSGGVLAGNIAVFARTQEALQQIAAPAIQKAGLQSVQLNDRDPLQNDRVAIGTMHLAKGLEFRAVALVGCDAQHLPLTSLLQDIADEGDRDEFLGHERNLFYVACSRARESLRLSYVGQPSPFITVPSPKPKTEPAKPTKTTKTPFKISPSRVARYFEFDCERYLRFDATQNEARMLADGVPQDAVEASSLVEAIWNDGNRWEQEVLEKYLPGKVSIAPGDGPLNKRRFSWADTLQQLRDTPVGTYIYQATLRAPQRFYQKHRIDQELVSFSDNHPDLIGVHEINGKRTFRIYDMKRGAEMRSSYRIQLSLYAMILEEILATENIEGIADTATGAIWLGGHPEPTECDLKHLRSHLESFLQEDLGRILTLPPKDVSWHVYFRCEWCRFFSHCFKEMQETDDVSRLYQLSRQGKKHLRAAGASTIASLSAFLQEQGADKHLSQCASLAGKRTQLETKSKSLQQDAVLLYGAASPGLPRVTRREISLIITVQKETLGQALYVAGFHIKPGELVPPGVATLDGKPSTRLFLAETQARCDNIRRQFIFELHGLLLRLDAYNLNRPWEEQLALQSYVFSSQENELLLELLFAGLNDPETAKLSMLLLLYFQDPGLILTKEHPEDNVPYPVVGLLASLAKLLALPVDVSYTLPEALQKLGCTFVYPRDEKIHFPLGPALRGESIFDVWHRSKLEELPVFMQAAEKYLLAVSALHDAIREKAQKQLFAWTPKFRLPTAAQIQDPLLSKLAFFAQYESAIQCKGVRETRAIARQEVASNEGIFELEAISDVLFQGVSEAPLEIDDQEGTSYLLARDTQEGRFAQLQYADSYYSKTPWLGKKNNHVAVVSFTKAAGKDKDGFINKIELQYQKAFDTKPPKAGERFLLLPRFSDWLTENLIEFLASLDGKQSLFLTMLRNPEKLPEKIPLPAAVEQQVQATEAALSLTPSQQEAYRAIRSLPVLALWGPPGTGKTHFLASAIIGLAEAHHRAGKPFHVLVTAFTHAAIENLLKKLVERREQLSSFKVSLDVGKAKQWNNKPDGDVSTVPDGGIVKWLKSRNIAVVGATIWAARKEIAKGLRFDLVVVDEASQVKVPEAAISTSLVKDGGHLAFVGDHLQLPPIVQGEYPAPPKGEPVLHRSIFEAVRALRGGHFERQLQENFRMNETLTKVSSELLYGPGYKCFDEKVAKQRLRWSASEKDSALVKACLDPAYPLVLLVLNGVLAGKQNETEAKIVAELAVALRERLQTAGGQQFADDKTFAGKGLFIVSPHHNQIRTIRRALSTKRRWDVLPKVDTVDKMQGQEAEAVLVSYGVSDAEFAAQEAKFIYSLQRLNVSITRAKSKLVLCIPRPLLDAPPQVLDKEEAAEGLGYMRGLAEILYKRGEGSRFLVDGGLYVDLYRLAPT